MKRDKVLKIGYDGHSEFITIETDNHGWGKILDICKHESFHKVDIFGAYRLAGYVFVVDAKNSIKRMEAELINPSFARLMTTIIMQRQHANRHEHLRQCLCGEGLWDEVRGF